MLVPPCSVPDWLLHATSEKGLVNTPEIQVRAVSQSLMLCPSLKISQWPPGSRYRCKSKRVLLPSTSWGSHWYRRSSYREEPWALGYIAYIGYYRAKNSKNGSLQVWVVTFWWRVRCWVLIGSPFLGLTRISQAGQGFWLIHRWWGEVGISKGSFPGTLQNGVA